MKQIHRSMGVTQSALSHAIRGLEEQVGVRLLARTTRSVAPTEAGEQLLAELRPPLTGIRGAIDRLAGLRDTPRGRVRPLVPRLAAMSVLGPKLAEFARTYPDVVLDVSTDVLAVGWGVVLEDDEVAVLRDAAAMAGAPVGGTAPENVDGGACPATGVGLRDVRQRERHDYDDACGSDGVNREKGGTDGARGDRRRADLRLDDGGQ